MNSTTNHRVAFRTASVGALILASSLALHGCGKKSQEIVPAGGSETEGGGPGAQPDDTAQSIAKASKKLDRQLKKDLDADALKTLEDDLKAIRADGEKLREEFLKLTDPSAKAEQAWLILLAHERLKGLVNRSVRSNGSDDGAASGYLPPPSSARAIIDLSQDYMLPFDENAEFSYASEKKKVIEAYQALTPIRKLASSGDKFVEEVLKRAKNLPGNEQLPGAAKIIAQGIIDNEPCFGSVAGGKRASSKLAIAGARPGVSRSEIMAALCGGAKGDLRKLTHSQFLNPVPYNNLTSDYWRDLAGVRRPVDYHEAQSLTLYPHNGAPETENFCLSCALPRGAPTSGEPLAAAPDQVSISVLPNDVVGSISRYRWFREKVAIPEPNGGTRQEVRASSRDFPGLLNAYVESFGGFNYSYVTAEAIVVAWVMRDDGTLFAENHWSGQGVGVTAQLNGHQVIDPEIKPNFPAGPVGDILGKDPESILRAHLRKQDVSASYCLATMPVLPPGTVSPFALMGDIEIFHSGLEVSKARFAGSFLDQGATDWEKVIPGDAPGKTENCGQILLVSFGIDKSSLFNQYENPQTQSPIDETILANPQGRPLSDLTTIPFPIGSLWATLVDLQTYRNYFGDRSDSILRKAGEARAETQKLNQQADTPIDP